MAKRQTTKMPLKYAKRTLRYHGLDPIGKKLSNGEGVQFCLARDGFIHVKVSVYKTGAVVVQPHGDPAGNLVNQILALRAMKLWREGTI